MIYTSLYSSIEYADGTLEIILVFLHQKNRHLKSVLFPKNWRHKDRVKPKVAKVLSNIVKLTDRISNL